MANAANSTAGMYAKVTPFTADTTDPMKDYNEQKNKDEALNLARKRQKAADKNKVKEIELKDIENNYGGDLGERQISIKQSISGPLYDLKARAEDSNLSREEQQKAEKELRIFETRTNQTIMNWNNIEQNAMEGLTSIHTSLNGPNQEDYDLVKLNKKKDEIHAFLKGKYLPIVKPDGTAGWIDAKTNEEVDPNIIADIINYRPEKTKQGLYGMLQISNGKMGKEWVLNENTAGNKLYKDNLTDSEVQDMLVVASNNLGYSNFESDIEDVMKDLKDSGEYDFMEETEGTEKEKEGVMRDMAEKEYIDRLFNHAKSFKPESITPRDADDGNGGGNEANTKYEDAIKAGIYTSEQGLQAYSPERNKKTKGQAFESFSGPRVAWNAGTKTYNPIEDGDYQAFKGEVENIEQHKTDPNKFYVTMIGNNETDWEGDILDDSQKIRRTVELTGAAVEHLYSTMRNVMEGAFIRPDYEARKNQGTTETSKGTAMTDAEIDALVNEN